MAPAGSNWADSSVQAHPQIKIIFISGYVRYAPEVYEVPHVYFVWKPDLEVRLPQALQAACRESRRSVLPLNWKGHKKFIFMDEIMYIERELRKSRIVLPECEHYVYMARWKKPTERLAGTALHPHP